jgi:trehalose synthase
VIELRPVEVRVPAQRVARYEPVMDADAYARAVEAVSGAVAQLAGRVVWHVNSTARGGGVAEMMGPLIGCARDAGVDARWLVIAGTPEFFRITKRIHNLLHEDPGDGGALGDSERRVYDGVLAANGLELRALLHPGDLVVLHDPQAAGLIPAMRRSGAFVIWRCHIGRDEPGRSALAERGWSFLEPYLRDAHATVFSRREYVPACCDAGRAHVIRPAIDPFSPKNQEMADETVRAILAHVGLVGGPPSDGERGFLRDDGTPGRVDRCADILRLGPPPAWETPLVVQVSRWDRLKDPVGVLRGFAHLTAGQLGDATLVLAGPTVRGVADDPDGPAVFEEVTAAWRALPHERRRRVQLAALPMADPSENAVIVNALQRHAAVVLQKSLEEGFGLTVTEAMWKGRPVVASAVGGIVDQIEDGREGILLADPADPGAFAGALHRVLADGEAARRMGAAGRERVRREFLGIRLLADEAELAEEVVAASRAGAAA